MTAQSVTTGAIEAAAPLDAAPRKTSYGVLLLLSLAIGVAWTLLGLFSPMQETAKAEMGLTDDQMGLLQGAALAIPLALFALPLGRMTDSGRRVPILIGLGVAWTLGVIGSAFAPEFWTLFLARMLVGMGAVLVIPVAISMGADLSRPQTRGLSTFVLGIGKSLGQAAAFVVGAGVFTWLTTRHGLWGLSPWRASHLVIGLGGAVLLLPLALLREPRRYETEAGDHSLRTALHEIWARRGFLVPLYLAYVAVIMADVAAAVWAAPILERFYHQAPADYGGWMGAVVLGPGILGGLIGGVAADIGHKSRIKGGLLIGAVIGAAIGVPAAAFCIMPSVPLYAVFLGLLLFAGAVMGLITATAMALVIPNEIRGVCLAVLMVVGGVLGFGVAPILVTTVSRVLGGETMLAQATAIVGVVASGFSLLGFLFALRGLRQAAPTA